MELETVISDRGFKHIRFFDSYGVYCSIHESSEAEKKCVWLGTVKDLAYMHLSQEDVKTLLPYLQKFAESGRL